MNPQTKRELENIITDGYGNVAGIVVLKNGSKVYESYFNGCTSTDAIHVFSVTKSVFSALIGIAIEKGYIKSVDQKVLDFFPEYAVKDGETGIQDITVENLLTMTAPFKYEAEPYEAFFASPNWVNAALDLLGGGKPAGIFQYSPIIGAHILSGILARATGKPILDFANENLFLPLDIRIDHNVELPTLEEHLAFYSKERHAGSWAVDPQGLNTASWGLTLTPSDMAKIGQLYLNGGLWEGKPILSPQWVETSVTTHATWNRLAYGYLWWVIDGKDRIYAAMGDGGNTIYVNTKKHLVIAIASFFVADARDRLALIAEQIEPAFSDMAADW